MRVHVELEWWQSPGQTSWWRLPNLRISQHCHIRRAHDHNYHLTTVQSLQSPCHLRPFWLIEHAGKQCVSGGFGGVHPQVEWPWSVIFQVSRKSAATRTFDRCDNLVWRSSFWRSQVRKSSFLKNSKFIRNLFSQGSCYVPVVRYSKTC